jgi:steroid 5-alpha reductase family enzyme
MGLTDVNAEESFLNNGTCNLLELTWDEANTPTPIRLCWVVCLFFTFLVFVVSEVSKNYSQTDKLWSITPFVYTWILVCDARTLLMAILSTGWGFRLTWNFARRGGYTWPPWEGDEDYRWKYIQEGYLVGILKNQMVWTTFNFVFISLYQHVLLLVVVSPSIVAHVAAKRCAGNDIYSSSLNGLDLLASVLYLGFIFLESVADNQQHRFQSEKHRKIANGETLDGEYLDGFTRSGLFSIVRKPNYACEQALWVSFGLFSLSTFQSGEARQVNLLNWSHVGWMSYVLLFQGSGPFTEKISLTKYPLYQEYKKETPLFVPNILKLIFGKQQGTEKKKQ